jgi:hypothetical protein
MNKVASDGDGEEKGGVESKIEMHTLLFAGFLFQPARSRLVSLVVQGQKDKAKQSWSRIEHTRSGHCGPLPSSDHQRPSWYRECTS